MFTQKTFVTEHLASFFHFKKHEYVSFAKLMSSKMDLNKSAQKKLDDLNAVKLKMF